MSMNPVKPAGYFGRAVDERRLNQFLRSGEGLIPQSPGLITEWDIDAAPGGALTISIEAMPDAGDAVYWGDARGVILDTQWSYDAGEAISLLSVLPAVHLVTLPPELDGLPVEIRVRVVALSGVGPWSEAKVALGDANTVLPYTLPFTLGA